MFEFRGKNLPELHRDHNTRERYFVFVVPRCEVFPTEGARLPWHPERPHGALFFFVTKKHNLLVERQ